MLNIYNQKNNNHDGDLTPPVAPTKKTKVDASRFEDVTGEFTTSQFKRSVWYVTHKVLIYKISVGVLIVASIGLWLFSMLRWGDYVINGIKSDIDLHNNLVSFPDYTGAQARYAPSPITISGVNGYVGGSKTYDLVAEVSNPNKNFIVYFDYYFLVGDQKTPNQKGFLLAGESRPLVYFGFKDGVSGDINMVMENVAWKRITAHTIADPISWQVDRLKFSTKEFSFAPSASQTSDEITANVVRFKLSNNSAFGFRDGLFVVGLMQNNGLVGVMPVILKDFKSLETREVDLRNFVDNLSVSDVQIFPLIDIYNQEVYLPPQR